MPAFPVTSQIAEFARKAQVFFCQFDRVKMQVSLATAEVALTFGVIGLRSLSKLAQDKRARERNSGISVDILIGEEGEQGQKIRTETRSHFV